MNSQNAVSNINNIQTTYLTERLRTGLRLAPACQVGADIGSDHGKMAVTLLQHNICKRVIATDISAPSLAKARKAARTFGLEEYLDLKVGNGLFPIEKEEVDIAIIAGMGGELISKILLEGDAIARSMKGLLLQPMQHAARLRFYLRSHEWRIEDESICREGRRVYEWMRIAPGTADNYPAEFEHPENEPGVIDEIGPLLFQRKDPLAIERLRFRQKTWQREYELARRGMTDAAGKTAAGLKHRVIEAAAALHVLETR